MQSRRTTSQLSGAQFAAITERKNWAKFGACAGNATGPEPGITWQSSDDVYIEWTIKYHDHGDSADKDAKDEWDDVDFKQLAARQVQAQLRSERFHQRLQQRKSNVNPSSSSIFHTPHRTITTQPTAATKGKYVPPFKRRGDTSVTTVYKKELVPEVKITNLSLNATHADVEELCTVFGPVKRVVFSRDKRTGAHRGIVYVTFEAQAHADKCIKMLDGHGYDHLILAVEKL